MTIAGFKSRNHPLQVERHGQLDINGGIDSEREKVDDRGTPDDLFRLLHDRFGFTIDSCATAANAKLPRYWTIADDGLAQPWAGERVWCNPPYSAIAPWIRKAWAEVDADLIVMLLPNNRAEQPWWQELVEPHRDRGDRLATEFLPGRPRFVMRDRAAVGPNERPPFGCCLLIWTNKESAA